MTGGGKILVTGACGRFGAALVPRLKQVYGDKRVLECDVVLGGSAGDITCFRQLSVLDKNELHNLVIREKIADIYHLAASLTVAGEKQPKQAWELNVQGLINVLDIAKCENIRVFWPSSIAVFGPNSPRATCPQFTVTEPSTIYGISKVSGELWCKYYYEHYGVDVRSIRYPGIISHRNTSRGGTTDYTIEIFQGALAKRFYNCYLKSHTTLPLMYMPDAVRAAVELMDAPSSAIKVRSSYNLSALSFSPKDLEMAIRNYLPAFQVYYKPDFRQQIAESWPASIDDRYARQDWNWRPEYNMESMTADMLEKLDFSKLLNT